MTLYNFFKKAKVDTGYDKDILSSRGTLEKVEIEGKESDMYLKVVDINTYILRTEKSKAEYKEGFAVTIVSRGIEGKVIEVKRVLNTFRGCNIDYLALKVKKVRNKRGIKNV